jgi:hypothetical protein
MGVSPASERLIRDATNHYHAQNYLQLNPRMVLLNTLFFRRSLVSENKRSTKKLTPEQIQERLPPELTLDASTYKNTGTKARFIDAEHGEFWIKPNKIFVRGTGHPARTQEKTRATFMLNHGVDHPMKTAAMRQRVEATNIRKYGHKSATGNAAVQQKTKQTCLQKLGVDHPSKTPEFQNKRKETCLRELGVEHPSQSEEFKLKKKQKHLAEHGVEHPTQLASTKQRIRNYWMAKEGVASSLQTKSGKLKTEQTLKERYGVSRPGQIPGVSEKIKNTRRIRYGKDHHLQSDAYRKELVKWTDLSGVPIIDRCREAGIESPAWAQHLCRNFGPAAAEQYIQNWNKQDGFRSSLERRVASVINAEAWNKTVIPNAKVYPDFKIGENKFLDVDGLYWHSELNKENTHHFERRKLFEVHGIRLLQIREDEVRDKPEIVKSVVENLQGKSRKIGARELEVRKVDAAQMKGFLNKNHMMSAINRSGSGLFLGDVLFAAMCVSVRDQTMKIERYCVANGYSVIGGLSRLLKVAIQEYSPDTVQSWVDLRYGDGHSLETLGFSKTRDVLGWRWTDGSKTYNRLRCRANMDARKLTEKEHAKELGWYKIFDAGQRLYVLYVKKR